MKVNILFTSFRIFNIKLKGIHYMHLKLLFFNNTNIYTNANFFSSVHNNNANSNIIIIRIIEIITNSNPFETQ